jgi:hypothetical protein
LLAPQIVPTAANTPAGQPGLLRPGTSCFVTSARSGYANRPNTSNWRYGDLHPVRFSALSAAPFPSCYISFPLPGFTLTLPDVISESPSLDAGSRSPAVHRVLAPVSSTASSAFPKRRMGRLPASTPRMTTSRRFQFRGCRYFVMFRPPSLLAPRVVPTAANTAAGQLGLLRPGLLCFVTSAHTGYANRPNTGN